MTNKEIIINGVDVSRCKYRRKCISSDNIGCKIDGFLCCAKPNCNYKQLKAKEQGLKYYKIQFNADTKEMDGYQNEIVKHLESIEYLRTQLRNKEQECEKLKEENLAYKQTCENLKNALDESMQECIDLAKVIEEHSQKQRLV